MMSNISSFAGLKKRQARNYNFVPIAGKTLQPNRTKFFIIKRDLMNLPCARHEFLNHTGVNVCHDPLWPFSNFQSYSNFFCPTGLELIKKSLIFKPERFHLKFKTKSIILKGMFECYHNKQQQIKRAWLKLHESLTTWLERKHHSYLRDLLTRRTVPW